MLILQKFVLLAIIILQCDIQAIRAQDHKLNQQNIKYYVVGFVGGLRSPEDINQGVVQIRNRIRELDCNEIQTNTYSHWHWRKSYKQIFQMIDNNKDGRLSAEEINNAPKLIIYGHSLGGWAVNKLERKLKKVRIPVELSVQIDSVGIGDASVPDNVKTAINYYQRTQFIPRGEKIIKAKDANSTIILGNILIKNVRHEALARESQISDLIFNKLVGSRR